MVSGYSEDWRLCVNELGKCEFITLFRYGLCENRNYNNECIMHIGYRKHQTKKQKRLYAYNHIKNIYIA